MNPAQLQAYNAVCEADAECGCHDLFIDGDNWFSRSSDNYVSDAIAAAAITDHLHTRLCVPVEEGMVSIRSDGSWRERRTLGARFNHKLSAYLAAHIVRLSLPRELVTEMEEA